MIDCKGKWKDFFFLLNKVPLVKEAYFPHLRMKECGVLFYSSLCLGAVGWASRSGGEKGSMTFFLTLRILPVIHPAVRMHCPHLANPHLPHQHHPHLHPHCPRGKGKKSHSNSGQSSSHWTTKPSTDQRLRWQKCAGTMCTDCKAVVIWPLQRTDMPQISYLGWAHWGIVNRCRRAFLLMNKNIFPPFSLLTGFFQGTS